MNFFDVYRESKEDGHPDTDKELLELILEDFFVEGDDPEKKISSKAPAQKIIEFIKDSFPNTKITVKDIELLQGKTSEDEEEKKQSNKNKPESYGLGDFERDRASKNKVIEAHTKRIDDFVTEYNFIPESYEEYIKENENIPEESKEKLLNNIDTAESELFNKAIESYREEHAEIAAYTDLRKDVFEFKEAHPDVADEKIAEKILAEEKYAKLEDDIKAIKRDQINSLLGINTHIGGIISDGQDSVQSVYEDQWKDVQAKVKNIEKRFNKLSKSKSLRKAARKNPALMSSLKAMGGLLSGIAAGVGVASAVLNFVVPGIDLFTEPATTLMKPVAVAGKTLQNAGSPMKSYRGNYKAKRAKEKQTLEKRRQEKKR